MPQVKNKTRCPWVGENPLYIKYHDQEWGVPVYNDNKIFEFLVLESAQAGLSWLTILKKRQNYKKAFVGFNPVKVARFGTRDFKRLMADAGIVRNRLKISAAINNAKKFLEIKKEFGTFAKYMWGFTGGKIIKHKISTLKDYPVKIEEAEALRSETSGSKIWAKDLKKRGFRFLGATICYAHMQAVGMVNDHAVNCFRNKK
ncbi:MAG: DNA-3-methyladenine glycosylase I [Patescibacteria group bacterium]|mgnify:FL=1